MGKLVYLSNYRQHARAVTVVASGAGDPGVYYCTRCEVDRFMLHPSGAIRCANCGAVMRNIQVSAARNIKKRRK